MTRWLVADPGARQWRPAIKSILDRGKDFSPQAVADLFVRLASGAADKLTGRYSLLHDDIEGVLADTKGIVARDIWALFVKGFAPNDPPR